MSTHAAPPKTPIKYRSGPSSAPTGGDAQSWFADLGPRGRKAFRVAFAGYGLDAFELVILTLTLSAIGTTFGVSKGATGTLATATLTASGLGGAVAFGVFGYVLAIGALRFLPETQGKSLSAVE